ncbi:CotH kinase family protein [Clostridium cylindrosporum]|uniref:Protein CotH n=1 Tax=Clostridium cylindrosporum DSM 605 TaxID=1121307 RepID=A0A0J8D833_CLOCY|nr:CotH kinase family protein [Clostridium cylindrosporum]KMT22220.1 protein CotH [Clostridium cylindrosporum DSM 605]
MNDKLRYNTMIAILIMVLGVTLILSYKYVYIGYMDYLNQRSIIANKNVKFTSKLPIIVIDSKGKDIGKDIVKAKMELYQNEKLENNITGHSNKSSNVEINLQEDSKGKYIINIRDNEGKPRDIEVLGMKRNSKWILNSPDGDKSLIRNYIVYNIASKIMDYTPQAKLCEVFIKTSQVEGITMKDYKGVYSIVESTKVSKDRVNLAKSINAYEITGYIVAGDSLKQGDNYLSTYTERIKKKSQLTCIYPDKGDVTQSQLRYIQNDLDSIEKRMYSLMYSDPRFGYREYIDIDSFIDYVILNEFFFNIKAGKKGIYFYKELGSKLKVGPALDFNISMGNFDEVKNHRYLRMKGEPWFEKLLTDQYFLDKLSKRYKALRKTYLSEHHVLKSIDNAVAEIGLREDKSYEKEISTMKKFIKDHGRWMDKYFETGEYLELTGNSKNER